MEKETREYMEKYHMTAPGDGVLVGLSGGADSVCLLYLLWCLQEKMGFSLRALHVHHGLRGEEADRDAEFSKTLCERLGLPFQEKRILAAEEARKLGVSVEEAGRLVRYRLLEEAAVCWEQEEGISVHIAVAHHGDDNAETILHHLFRGSGLKGLGGISPVRERIIRPLLWSGREEILAYLKEKNADWVEDSSNQENEYTRNRLRNELIPLAVREINSQAVPNILRAGERIRQADAYFEKQAEKWLQKHGNLRWSSRIPDAGEYSLDAVSLRAEEEILKGYIIRGAIQALSCPLKDLTARHVEEVLSLLEKGTGKQVMLPYGLCVWNEYETLKIRTAGYLDSGKSSPQIGQGEKAVPEKGWKMKTFSCENPGEFPKNQYTKWFDYDKIKDTIALRTRRQGDYITLSGGGKKTVKSYMIDAKIPREDREQIPLFADGSHILWIVGYRISEYYKVTAQTKTVLEIHFDGGNDSGA